MRFRRRSRSPTAPVPRAGGETRRGAVARDAAGMAWGPGSATAEATACRAAAGQAGCIAECARRGFRLALLALALTGCGDGANPVAPSPTDPLPTPTFSGPFAAELMAFHQQDLASRYPPGGVVFVGSSSIRFWDLDASFPGRKYLNRGFGGSQISGSIANLELLILRHAPSTVVFYAGDNDVAFGKAPDRVAADFRTLTRDVHARLPDTRILFLAIKPSIARWELVGEMREANRQIQAYCAADARLLYVDVHTPMIGPDGLPRPELLYTDGLHLSAAGYALWTRLVTPHLPVFQ